MGQWLPQAMLSIYNTVVCPGSEAGSNLSVPRGLYFTIDTFFATQGAGDSVLKGQMRTSRSVKNVWSEGEAPIPLRKNVFFFN